MRPFGEKAADSSSQICLPNGIASTQERALKARLGDGVSQGKPLALWGLGAGLGIGLNALRASKTRA